MSYNGWKNKETWLVNLWMGDMFQDMANEGYFDGMDIADIAERLEQSVVDYTDDTVQEQSGLIADFINMCLAEIDFRELARHLEIEEGYDPALEEVEETA